MNKIEWEENEYIKLKSCQNNLQDWLPSFEFSFHGILIFNSTKITIDIFTKRLKDFHFRVDRHLLGAQAYKKPRELRTRIFAFPEHIFSNFHGHLLISPPKNKLKEYKYVAPLIWERLCPSGELILKDINSNMDLRNVCGYVTKESWKTDNYGGYVISDEFIKNPK